MTLATINDTHDLTPFLFGPPTLRRPDATLILPAFAPPPPLRSPVPTVYGPKPIEVVKPLFRRGRRRMSWRMRLALALMGGAR